MKRIRDTPLSASELAVAKSFVRGAYFTTARLCASAPRAMLWRRRVASAAQAKRRHEQKAGAWIEEVARLNPGDVQRAARKYLKGLRRGPRDALGHLRRGATPPKYLRGLVFAPVE
jgi:hypothetical protein